MDRKLISCFISAFTLFADPLWANKNLSTMIGLSDSCGGCHTGGAPVGDTAQLFKVLSSTGSAVTQLQPNTNYTLQIKYQSPQSPSFVVAYKLDVSDGSITSTNQSGVRLIQNNSVAGYIDASNLAGAQTITLSYRSPASGRVDFEVVRMEANGNNQNDSSDRVSPNYERNTFDVVATSTGGGSTNTGGGGTTPNPTTSTAKGFSGEFVGGCGVIKAPIHSGPSLNYSALILLFIFALFLLRRRLHS